MDHRRLTDAFCPWIEEGLRVHGMGDSFSYEVIPAFMPVQPNTPPEPAMIVVIMMPGALLGSSFHNHRIVANPSLVTEEIVTESVRAMCEELRTLRSATLSQLQAQPQERANGDEPLRLVALPPEVGS